MHVVVHVVKATRTVFGGMSVPPSARATGEVSRAMDSSAIAVHPKGLIMTYSARTSVKNSRAARAQKGATARW